MKRLLCLLTLALAGHAAATETVVTVQPRTAVAGIRIDVPADARLLTVKATGGATGKLVLALRADNDFNVSANPYDQADYYSLNSDGTASISIGDYNVPALHAGAWYVALVNTGTGTATVTLDTATNTTGAPKAEFVIHFDKPSTKLEQIMGGADKLECDVEPWSDSTPLGSTTLGKFRRKLLQDTAARLAPQLRSPVPVHIQACWKEFDDSGEHAGAYTLAAATGVYSFYDSPGMPMRDTWYSQAAATRLGGTRACNLDASVDCSIPDIIIWYNKADIAKGNYDDPGDEPLIVSVTMHEITHGLGFLSHVAISNPDQCDEDPPPTGIDCDGIGKLWMDRNDAYTANVAYLAADAAQPSGDRRVVPFVDLSLNQRRDALVSSRYLAWNDAVLAASGINVLRNNPPPGNLVELHAPSVIQPGSTLSHLNAVHTNQLMTAVIQRNFPDTLGLAGKMLERTGWNTGPIDIGAPANPPLTGNWYDVAHSGHGISLERMNEDPEGDIYVVIFYSYDGNGASEYFYSAGRLRNGRYEDSARPGQPAPMGRPLYDPATHGATYPGTLGTVSVDFSAAAANDPVCAGNGAPTKAVLNWSMDGKSGKWCVSPLVGRAQRPSSNDLNGLWNAGSGDSGWGFSLQESMREDGPFLSPLLLYYYGTDNQPHWAQAEVVDYRPGQTTNLYRINGYCRTCAKQATTHDVIGTLTLNLLSPEHVETPSGQNRVSISINGGGTLKFQRSNAPVRMYSIPAGQ